MFDPAKILERVQAGLAFLDSHIQNWMDGVDLETLHMAGCGQCILGQLFSSFWNSHSHMSPTLSRAEFQDFAKSLGFYADYGPTNVSVQYANPEYDALQKEWLKEIKKRKSTKCLQQ
jgi:hypothetical protein